MKKVSLFVSGLLIGLLAGVAIFNIACNPKKSETQTEYVCSHYSNEFENIMYMSPATEIEFYQDEDEYFFNIALILNDQIDFSGYSENTTMFASISFDGLIPYSVLEANQKYIQIPLQNGKMTETFNFTVSSEDNAFSGDDLEILNDFLNQETDQLVVSINLFDPNGIITHVTNVFINR